MHFFWGGGGTAGNVFSQKYLKDGPLFPRGGGGGYHDWEKIVCMRKNAEINCLPQRCIWKKSSAETTYVMQDLGNLKKNCLHSRSGGKKLASAQSMVEKISCLLEITIPPLPSGEK